VIQVKTLEGHSLLATALPQGVTVAVVPDGTVLESDMLDVFSVSMRFTSVVRFLAALDHENGFVDSVITTRAKRRNGRITFEFQATHDPSLRFETVLDQQASQELVSFLGACINGREMDVLPASDQRTAPNAGRNAPCPCGSGKKFKKCCGSANRSTGALPDELKKYSETKDSLVRQFLSLASQDRACLADSDFWQELGAHLGTAGEFALALEAQSEAIRLNPENFGAKADYAATLSATGDNEEAWRIISQVPNENGVFSPIRGNILIALGREEEAINEYEKAIAAEPGFALPYWRLIKVLEDKRHPLFEYWVKRALRAHPRSPEIAFLYCKWLLGENRLEELADADWTEQLSHNPDPRVIGRQAEGPRCIVAVQALRLIAKSIVYGEADQLARAAEVISSAPPDWHLCQVAEQAARAAAFFGRRDIVWAASRRFCKSCCCGRLGPVLLQSLLGTAALQAGDSEQSVSDAELGLRLSPDDNRLLQFYWYALDEVGRSEEAFAVARTLHDKGVELPNLPYNIGFLAGKIGKPAVAKKFYQLQLDRDNSNAWTYENLALLMVAYEQDLKAASELVKQWTSNCGATDTTKKKLEKFELLMQYAESRLGEPTYSLDVLAYNRDHEPLFGADTVLPKQQLTREEMVAALTGRDSEATEEIIFAHSMEMKGDHSITAAKIESELPGVRSLPSAALRTLIEAEYQLSNTARADFAPCCMAFCKGLEIAMFRSVFVEFRNWVSALPEAESVFSEAQSDASEKAANFIRFATKQSPLELGAMAHALKLAGGKTASKLKLVGLFREWLTVNGYEELMSGESPDALSEIARSYRNPAAHAESFTHEQATLVRRLCFDQLRYLLAQGEKERNPR
jgi:tetratricopeptide (TPR) repeat protein